MLIGHVVQTNLIERTVYQFISEYYEMDYFLRLIDYFYEKTL